MIAESPQPGSLVDGRGRHRWLYAVTVAVIAAAGAICFEDGLILLWRTWWFDGLRSFGVLLLGAAGWLSWRALGGCVETAAGSWWGLGPIALALIAGNLSAGRLPLSYIDLQPGGPLIQFNLLPIGLLLWMYASGLAIYFGGFKVWRRLQFPLALLLFVNPMPRFFEHLVDLPLQALGARAARTFALALKVPVGGEGLRLSFFHDELGMFIAPACNGLRSAVAMGYLALILGYLRDLTLWTHVIYVSSAVMLAYVLNVFRLFLLVMFYCLAHWLPDLGAHAVAADYLIGAALFATGAALVARFCAGHGKDR